MTEDVKDRELRDLRHARSQTDLWRKAVEAARAHMDESGAEFIRDAHEQDPDAWWAGFHMRGGMAFRNWMRDNGFGERAFGIQNLDHIYVAVLEEAAGVRETV